MLSRRILRVKAMQALYGLFIAQEAIRQAIRTEIKKEHSLDFSKHDFTQKAEFVKKKRAAVSLFDKHYTKREIQRAEEGPELIASVSLKIRNYWQKVKKEAELRANEMIKEARALNDAYIKMLMLPIELEYQEKLEYEKDKRLGRIKKLYPFINHPVVLVLKKEQALCRLSENPEVKWEPDKMRHWYKKEVQNAEALAPFYTGEEPPQGFIMELYKKIIFKNESMDVYFEDTYLNWAENRSILKSMTVKTIKTLTTESVLHLAELTKNGEEDFVFFKRLFDDVVKHNLFLEEMIASRTENWEIDRITLTDRVLLKLALVEMMNSPSIPIKVSINEVVEISKTYSTPKSKQFINGILDVLSKELKLLGRIQKSGRGLIDNH